VEAVRAVLDSDQQLVELTALIAGYNLVARFLEALRLTPERTEDLPPMPVDSVV
jgi:alkylhydroperoxidase family enzyme